MNRRERQSSVRTTIAGTMHIQVSGKQIDIGDALRTHVEEHMSTSVGKYFDKAIEGNVVFSREAHLFRADVMVHVGHDIQFQGQGEADAPPTPPSTSPWSAPPSSCAATSASCATTIAPKARRKWRKINERQGRAWRSSI